MFIIGVVLVIIIFWFLLYVWFTDHYLESIYEYNRYLDDLWIEYDEGFLSIEQVRLKIKDCITKK